ncbi:MAG TPA: class I SAM-dependent methyltransferase [Planctomycetota bacterium]|nr:class I SAM-dependent methyltransferase [Planctomycetota bacterium]
MDPRSLLARPALFRAFKRAILRGGPAELVRRHVRPWPGARVLDLGCGLGDIVESLPPVDYDGYDTDPGYIASARRTYGSRGRFHCADATRVGVADGAYDLVLSIGILHHLDDEQVRELVGLAWRALAPGGRLITFDGCRVAGQSRIARYLLDHDRGDHVRDRDGYVRLVAERFDAIAVDIRSDWLRIPYTHIVLEATRPAAAAG